MLDVIRAPSDGDVSVATARQKGARHTPRSQLRPPPQAVPSAAAPASSQRGSPAPQRIAPRRHTEPAGVHALPSTHAMHEPSARHTPPGHVLPAGAGPTDSQRGAPLAQVICPRWQGAACVQVEPAAQATHPPAPSQTPPLQGLPGGVLASATQRATPEAQEMRPVRQAPGTQGVSWQAEHAPRPSQTPPLHGVPAAAGAPGRQRPAPVAQSQTPA